MYDARNLRSTERYLIAPPIAGSFAGEKILLADMSAGGARIRHAQRLTAGTGSTLRLAVDIGAGPFTVDAAVVWSEPEAPGTAGFVSGLRLADAEAGVLELLAALAAAKRASRIEELRAIDRFHLLPAMKGTFAGRPVYIEDLSTCGARIESLDELPRGLTGNLSFRLQPGGEGISVAGRLIWTAIKSMMGQFETWRSGIFVPAGADALRGAITRLSEEGNALLDTRSLRLKLKVMRARARAHAAEVAGGTLVGMPPEQYLLIEGVREELKLNPEEAFHWYKRARLSIADPQTRELTPPISDHPDALAVWEYLDRSVDPSIIGRAFNLTIK